MRTVYPEQPPKDFNQWVELIHQKKLKTMTPDIAGLTASLCDQAYDLALDHAIKYIKEVIKHLEQLKSKQPSQPYLVNNDQL